MTKPKVVIGIDPGGNGTTGIVVASGWERRTRTVLPYIITPSSVVASEGWQRPPFELGWDLDRLLRDYEIDQVLVAIEETTLWMPAKGKKNVAPNEDLKSTCMQEGVFRYQAESVGVSWRRILPKTYRSWWLRKAEKGKADREIDDALKRAYGGPSGGAVGGDRCKACGGRGRVGRGDPERPPTEDTIEIHGRIYNRCSDCAGEGTSPRGPLYDLWKPSSRQHTRAALALAIYAYNAFELLES